jgi:hypothetical protein
VAITGVATGGGEASTAVGGRPGPAGATAADQPGVPDVDLIALADHVGQTVRIGGLVEELAPDGFTLNDGTATGRVALIGEAAEYLPLVDPGDALNATGRVEADADAFKVVVSDAAGLVRVGDPTAAASEQSGAEVAPAGARDGAEPASRAAGGLLGTFEPGAAGVAGVVLLSGCSLAVTMLRRRRARRLLAVRVGARLARIGTGPASPPAAPPAGPVGG